MKKILEEDIYFCSQLSFMQDLKDKTILVIGATGMIGLYLLKVLYMYNVTHPKNMCYISGLCRNKEKLKKLLSEEIYENIEIIEGDLLSLDRVNKDYDYIIYAAGDTNPETYLKRPVEIYGVNTIGVHNILKNAVNCTSFLFISSASVYGNLVADRFKEEDCGVTKFYKSESVYCESKRMAECICMSQFKQNSIPVKIVRPFHMYGPGMSLDSGNMIAEFMNCFLNGCDITIKGGGTNKRNFTYIRDIIWELFFVLLRGKNGNIYNLGSEKNTYSVSEFAEFICMCNHSNGMQIHYLDEISENPSNSYDMKPDLEKLNSIMGGNIIKKVEVREGLERMYLYVKG